MQFRSGLAGLRNPDCPEVEPYNPGDFGKSVNYYRERVYTYFERLANPRVQVEVSVKGKGQGEGMNKKLIATLTGPDQVGFVERVTRHVVACEGNIEASRMARLEGEFSMLMLVSVKGSG